MKTIFKKISLQNVPILLLKWVHFYFYLYKLHHNRSDRYLVIYVFFPTIILQNIKIGGNFMISRDEGIVYSPQLEVLASNAIDGVNFVKKQLNIFATNYEYNLDENNTSQTDFLENFIIFFLEWYLDHIEEKNIPINQIINIINCLFNTTFDPCMYN